MPGPEHRSLVEQLPAALRDDLAALPDGRLLERFLLQRDEPAFEALLRRHRAMVFGVCRRVLPHPADAEDAFQAVFLVLLRRGRGLVQRDNLGNWLYGVAYNTARKARTLAQRRLVRESGAVRSASETPGDPVEQAESLRLLDEELSRLPEMLREAIVLCVLQEMPVRDAAVVLGVPAGTLSGRLTSARRRLADRLARRGVDAPALLALATTPAAVPAVDVAASGVAGEIAREVLATMIWSARLKLMLLGVVVLLGLGGIAVGVRFAMAERPAEQKPTEPVLAEEPLAPEIPEEQKEFSGAQLDVKTAAIHPAGVPILLDVKLTNLSKDPLPYWCGGPGDYPGFNQTVVTVTDARGRKQALVLSNGQYLEGSGINRRVESCTSISVPAVCPDLPPGEYTLRIGRGVPARIVVKADADLTRQWEQDLIKQIRAGRPFAQHVAHVAATPGVTKALLADLTDGTPAAAREAAYTFWQTKELPAGIGAAVGRALPRRLEEFQKAHDRRTDLIDILAMIAARIKSDDLIDSLIAASKADIGDETRSRFIDALGEFPQEKVLAELHRLVTSAGGRVQFSAAWALAKKKDTFALPFLLKVAGEANHHRREDAFYLLRYFKTDLVVEAVLKRALQDADPRIADAARRSLQ
jgi:RNA polymerase sigma factor (sigma-70 family)